MTCMMLTWRGRLTIDLHQRLKDIEPQVRGSADIARQAVKLGLGDWIATKV